MNQPNRKYRINEAIRSPRLFIVDEDGTKIGEMSTTEALSLAQDKGLDLIEIAPMANPPVAKILDFGKFKYEQSRAERKQRRSAKPVIVKEIRLGMKIQEHDLNVKRERAKEFLSKHHKVKVNLMFRGREIIHPDLGFALIEKFYEPLAQFAEKDGNIVKQGRSLSLILRPK